MVMSDKSNDENKGEVDGTLKDDVGRSPSTPNNIEQAMRNLFGGEVPPAVEPRDREVSELSGEVPLRQFLDSITDPVSGELVLGDEQLELIRARVDQIRETYRERESSGETEALSAELLTLAPLLPELQADFDDLGEDEASRRFQLEDVMGLTRKSNEPEATTQVDLGLLASTTRGPERSEESLELDLGTSNIVPPEGTGNVEESSSGNLAIDAGLVEVPEDTGTDNLFGHENAEEVEAPPLPEAGPISDEPPTAMFDPEVVAAEAKENDSGAEALAPEIEEELAQEEVPVEEIPPEGVVIDASQWADEEEVEDASSEVEAEEEIESADTDSEVEEAPRLGMTQVLGEGSRAEDEDSWYLPEETEKPRGMGMGTPAPREPKGSETVVGVSAAKAPEEEPASQSSLSRTGLFGEFDGDPTMDATSEGSRADILDELMPPREVSGDPSSRRMPTVELASGALSKPLEEELDSIDAAGREPTPEEMAHTRLSVPGGENPDLGTTLSLDAFEDFSRYGDIFYVIEKAFVETGNDPTKIQEFEARLELAIEYAELISEGVGKVTELGDLSPEHKKLQRLKSFKREFVEIPKGQSEPAKSINAYRYWRASKEKDYKKAERAFELLGISAGEYSRIEVLRICDAVLTHKAAEGVDLTVVSNLKSLIEEKVDESEVDEFAAARNAELAYEMIVGFATKRERQRISGMVVELDKLEGKDRDNKINANIMEEKRQRMSKTLGELYITTREVDASQVDLIGIVPEAKEELLKHSPAYAKRQKQFGEMFEAVGAKKGEGKTLFEEAKERAARKLGRAESKIRTTALKHSLPQQPVGPIRRAIGVTIPAVIGAGILAAGLWLGQNGIIQLGSQDTAAPEKEAIVEVQEKTLEADTETSLPAGVVGGVDAALEKAEAGTGREVVKEKPVEAKEPVEEVETEPEEKPVVVPPKPKVDYPRTPEGLASALDAHCAPENARGLFTSVDMLRWAYGTIEKDLAKKKVLPEDKNWPNKIFRMRIRNKEARVAIMADLLRRSDESGLANFEQKYAAGMVLAADLGNRSGGPKRFRLPKGEKESGSPIGLLESRKTLFARFAAVSAYLQVVKLMEQMKREAIVGGKTEKEFEAAVDKVLGPAAKRYKKALEKGASEARFIYNRSEKKGGYKEPFRLYTQGRTGMRGISAIDWVLGKQKKNQEARKKADASIEEITGEIPPEVKKMPKRSTPSKKTKKSTSQESNLEFLDRTVKERSEATHQKRDERLRGLYSYRGGVGADIRRAKREAEQRDPRSVRLGVPDKKPSPFKRMMAKLKPTKGLERSAARA